MSAHLGVTISLCLALAPALVAADRRVEGTVKAVDADHSTVTITTMSGATTKDESLDVVKKAKITVNGQPATLKDVLRGQQAVAVVNTELEIVTKLDATGEGVAPLVPEITVVSELPETERDHTGPWVSDDGLTLYWKNQPGISEKGWIWSARRPTKDDLFGDAKRLVPGGDMTVTSDGLEMILLLPDGLWATTRPSLDAAFVRPRKVAELQGHGFLASPCFGGNDLILYADLNRAGQPPVPVRFTRTDRRAKWGAPTPVKLTLPAGKRVRFFSVTPEGSRAFCLLFDVPAGKPDTPFWTVPNELAMMRAEGDGFGRPVTIRVNGEPLRGIFPRYVAATNELFFARNQEGKPAEIVLVRNFDPDAIDSTPTAAANPARTDRELLQGHWVSVSEVNSGNALTAEKLRDMNKRMDVHDDKMDIRRTGLDGKFAVFEGSFRLDPDAVPKTFDWTGKGPDGAFELHGIYELDGDTFRLCHAPGPRPTELRSTTGSGRQLIVYKRERK